MIKYNVQYHNAKAAMRLLNKIKDYVESDFYSDFSPPEEAGSEEDFVYGVQNCFIRLWVDIKHLANQTQYDLKVEKPFE